MTVTPVANWLSACRKSVAVSGVAVMFEVFEDIILGGVRGKSRAGDSGSVSDYAG